MEKSQVKPFIARRVAREIHDGDVINLGIGLPTYVADYIPHGVHVVLHSENGMIGTGPTPTAEEAQPLYVTDAGGFPAAIGPGGAFIDSYTSGRNHVTRHAAIFAILYDFVDAATQKRISESVLKGELADPITTPYFKFFELMALGKMGDIIGIQDYIDSYWGTMVRLGASSVWEQFDPRREGTEHLEMYGEKYGCSLCHAWGAGPIALLGIYCAGVRPTDTAYKTFDVAPNPGRYNSFEAVVPVCGGSVYVKYENGSVEASATVPGGTLYWNGVSAAIPVNSSCVITANG